MDSPVLGTVRGQLLILFVKACVIAGTGFCLGWLVRANRLKVNYSRKVLHFLMLLVPLALDLGLEQTRAPITVSTLLENAGMLFLLLSLCAQPIRARISFVATIFLAIDRPEDRPHTLPWLVSQCAAAYTVLVAAVFFVPADIVEPVLLVPLIAVGVGDGLAEPVGVRYGRHRYTAYGLNGATYGRTVEGSVCVFGAAIVGIWIYSGHFEPLQWALLLLVLPVLMTLAEAASPHTWDAPLMLAVGSRAAVATCRAATRPARVRAPSAIPTNASA